ncbi:TRAP transporter large permease [Futiania mangrovi]|uniref:TRAP transporter large permease protein n=1 Tax=Futiania mangrovi TaxID=2959716 RepID=A0A9J6PKC6_9PROT|nr:TRAP transporter large permease subunit [Futiania mangrovii]MCP1337015.1 TRAP transporter large permease subunit [Futiania mangrovii]
MSGLEIGFGSLGVLLLLMLLRVPVGIALGLVAYGGIYLLLGPVAAWGILTAIPYDFTAHWTLSSVPMFLLMGYVCFHAQLTEGLFRVARAWLSWLPGGLAVASVGASAAFSAVTGSSVACAAAMGRIVVPEMLRANYDKGLATGVVAAAGTIGSMIPPSIILLIYGIFAEVPIGKLFVAGILPGLLSAFMFGLMIVIRVSRNPELAPTTSVRETLAEKLAAFRGTWPVIVLVIGVFGGLFGGVFTPTEAGAVGAGLAFLIAFAQRTLTRKTMGQAVLETLYSTSSIFIIAIGAALLTRLMALAGVADYLSDLVVQHEVGTIGLLIGISVVYLILGMFLDPIGIMLLTLPIFLPVVQHVGVDLIWFGILLAKYLEIALITPPVGLNVFVIKGMVGNLVSTATIYRGVMWFLVADLITLGLLIGFPAITLTLPSLMD